MKKKTSRGATKAFMKALNKTKPKKKDRALKKRTIKPRFAKKYKPGMKPKKKAAPKPAKKGGGFKTHTVRVTSSSKKMDWRSPDSLIKLIEKVAGKIQLDPSADHREKHQFAKTNYVGQQKGGKDGLIETWRGFGVVYSNPPYGRGIIKWVKKAVHEWKNGTGLDAVDHIFLLLPARPDTKWYQEHIRPHASSVCFWKGRLKFSGHKDACPFPSLIVYFGRKPKKFRKVFRRFGWVPRLSKEGVL